MKLLCFCIREQRGGRGACTFAQSTQSLGCSHTKKGRDVNKGSNQIADISPAR